MTTEMGHNERTSRLGLLADDAKRGMVLVEQGEGKTIEGWLIYGAALNEGRELFAGDAEFGQWVSLCQLDTADRHERVAAMWAAANPDDFETAKDAGNARTVRGIHAKWGEMNAENAARIAREKADAERAQAEKEKAAADEARRIAHERKAEAAAQAAAEERAHRAAREAKDEAERLAAQERHRIAIEAREKAAQAAREADERASFNEATAQAASISAKKSDRAAGTAQKKLIKLQSGKEEKNVHVSNNSGENEWYTPALYIEAARAAMGGIDLDPATSEVANRTVQASTYFTAQDDGLAQPWPIGRIWMNPPYAQPLMGQFAEKMAQEVERGSESVVLVNNATETVWFQRMASVCSAICFPRSRIRYLTPNGEPGNSPLQGQAIIYSGPNADRFAAEFSSLGLVVRNVG